MFLIEHAMFSYFSWLGEEGNQNKAIDKVNYKMTYVLNAVR